VRSWAIAIVLGSGAALLSSLYAFQLPFREYPAIEYNDFPLPPDYQQKTEFVFARLMYPPADTARFDRTRGGRRGRRGFGGFGGGTGGDWSGGNSSWTQDYPRADRHFVMALRRLTRIDVRSVEQPVNLNDEDDVFNWPFLYAVRPGEWELTDAQAKKFHEFLDRGGFFMTDDFWGSFEWGVFMRSMSKVMPGKQPADIADDDPIFHTLYDLKDRYQIPGAWGLYGRGYQNDGDTPYWRAIYDDKQRVIAAITPNSDLGDSWEFADAPEYPERYSALGIRIGVNYIVYAMTH
jgi:hypothetical protein